VMLEHAAYSSWAITSGPRSSPSSSPFSTDHTWRGRETR
jgi:hypothetical protein